MLDNEVEKDNEILVMKNQQFEYKIRDLESDTENKQKIIDNLDGRIIKLINENKKLKDHYEARIGKFRVELKKVKKNLADENKRRLDLENKK